MEVRLDKYSNARSPILVTEFGIIVFVHPAISVLVFVSIIALQSFLESYVAFPFSIFIEVRLVQPAKTPLPMAVTLLGMVMEVRPVQWENAPPMLVTLLGMVTEVRPEQSWNAEFPMLVTFRVLPIYVTCSGMTTLPE